VRVLPQVVLNHDPVNGRDASRKGYFLGRQPCFNQLHESRRRHWNQHRLVSSAIPSNLAAICPALILQQFIGVRRSNVF